MIFRGPTAFGLAVGVLVIASCGETAGESPTRSNELTAASGPIVVDPYFRKEVEFALKAVPAYYAKSGKAPPRGVLATCRPAGGDEHVGRNFSCIYAWPNVRAAKEHNLVCLAVDYQSGEAVELPGRRFKDQPRPLDDDLAGSGVC